MISRDFVFNYFKEKQDSAGGYTGDDIIEQTTETGPKNWRRGAYAVYNSGVSVAWNWYNCSFVFETF